MRVRMRARARSPLTAGGAWPCEHAQGPVIPHDLGPALVRGKRPVTKIRLVSELPKPDQEMCCDFIF